MLSDKDILSNELAELFVTTAEAIRVRLADKGIPETYPVDHWRGKKCISEVNIMYYALHDATISDHWQQPSETVVNKMYECAEKLNQLSSTFPFWTEKGRWYIPVVEPKRREDSSLEFSKNPTEWILTFLIRPTLHAGLADLPTVSSADISDGRLFAEEVLSVGLSSDRQYTVSFNMINLKAQDADIIAAGDLSLQNVYASEDDYITLGDIATLHLRVRVPRSATHQAVCDDVHRLVTALQLLGFDAAFEDSPYVYPGRNWFTAPWHEDLEGIPSQFYISGEKEAITSSDLGDIIDIMARLKKYHFLRPRAVEEFSIHQFRLGMARETYADALLNFVIVLEALLLRGEKTELTYRFKINGANYLSDSPAEKELRYNQLGELYEFRSRLVHGGKKYPSETELEEKMPSSIPLISSWAITIHQRRIPDSG